MKKILTALLLSMLLCLSIVPISAEDAIPSDPTPVETAVATEAVQETAPATEPPVEETPSTEPPVTLESLEVSEDTVIPAVEQLINLLFDGKVTVSQIIEYATLIALSLFSFLYNKYKKKMLLKEKAISKTDVEIEDLKAKQQDLINQVGLLGNILVSAYLSNNLIDPELKKKLATYAEELMDNTSLDTNKLTERLILAAQNPEFKETVAAIKESIAKKADDTQEGIANITKEVDLLAEILTQPQQDAAIGEEASAVIDNLKIGE